jgi:hypothetical protein
LNFILLNRENNQILKPIKLKIMTLQENIFANALTVEELEAKFKSTVEGVFSFFTDSSCGIDTTTNPR